MNIDALLRKALKNGDINTLKKMEALGLDPMPCFSDSCVLLTEATPEAFKHVLSSKVMAREIYNFKGDDLFYALIRHGRGDLLSVAIDMDLTARIGKNFWSGLLRVIKDDFTKKKLNADIRNAVGVLLDRMKPLDAKSTDDTTIMAICLWCGNHERIVDLIKRDVFPLKRFMLGNPRCIGGEITDAFNEMASVTDKVKLLHALADLGVDLDQHTDGLRLYYSTLPPGRVEAHWYEKNNFGGHSYC